MIKQHRILAWTLFAVGVGGFALPTIWMIAAGTEHTALTPESLAYRYFISARVLDGERVGIWLPQGFTLSVIQHGIQLLLNLFFDSTEYAQRWKWFGIGSAMAVVAINALTLYVATMLKALSNLDRAILAAVSVVPVLGFGHYGLQLAGGPDYLQLDLVIVTMSVLIFLGLLRGAFDISSVKAVVGLGAFVGLATANKLTMLPVALMSLTGAALQFERKAFTRWILLGIKILSVALFAFLTVILCFYLFDWRAAGSGIYHIFGFAVRGGPEPQFWENLSLFLRIYNYYFVFCAFFLSGLLSIGIAKGDETTKQRLLVTMILAAGVFQISLLWQRPAGTTLFEITSILVGYTGMILAVSNLPSHGRRDSLPLPFLVAAALLVTLTLPLQEHQNSMSNKSANLKIGWAIFQAAQTYGKPVVVVIPDNRYAWENPEQVLLKGLSQFPTWNVTAGQRYLAKLAAPITFRTMQGGPRPDEPYRPDATIIWYDRTDLKPLAVEFPALAQAAASRSCKIYDINAWIRTTICFARKSPSS